MARSNFDNFTKKVYYMIAASTIYVCTVMQLLMLLT